MISKKEKKRKKGKRSAPLPDDGRANNKFVIGIDLLVHTMC